MRRKVRVVVEGDDGTTASDYDHDGFRINCRKIGCVAAATPESRRLSALPRHRIALACGEARQ
eukprot:COSAG01_NODE_7555_length_3164_cov_15.727392_1_plen_62_part_10